MTTVTKLPSKPKSPSQTKQWLLGGLCVVLAGGGIWLVAAIALDWEFRVVVAALVLMGLSGFFFGLLRQEILIDKITEPTDVQKDDPKNWEVGTE